MNITEMSVRRPAAITMVIVLLLGLGLLGYSRLGANLMPSTNSPVISVMCSYSGASSEDIKRDIVKPIENALAAISGIETISSSARVGSGSVMLQFSMETNMDSAMMDVSKAIERVSGRLPDGADRPVIMKFDSDDAPVMTLAINGDIPYEELYARADYIKQQIEKLQGVGGVGLMGSKSKKLYVTLDKTAADFYGININNLMSTIRAANSSAPLGQLKNNDGEQAIRLVGEFKDISDINNLLVPIQGGGSIRLAEIAKVELTYSGQEQILRLDGFSGIGINIQKQSDANIVEVTDRVKKQLDEVIKNLPPDVKLVILDDNTTFIKSSLNEIRRNLIEGIITTAIVLLFFLRSWRSSLIVLIAIPTSLVSAFFMMYISGFTMNIMSLMGMSLCVGILVDDSIVIIENIQRHLKMGKSLINAAIEGRKEIGMAAIAITLCDVVVFAPVAFMPGMTGQYFKEFGLTVVFASLFSLFVSFTVTPALASRMLKKDNKIHGDQENYHKKSNQGFIKIYNMINAIYKKFLIWSLNNRIKVMAVFLLAVLACVMLLPLKFIKSEYQPQTDESKFTIRMSLKPGSSLVMADEKVKMVEEYLKTIPEITAFYSNVNSTSASISVRLVGKNERKKTTNDISAEVRRWGSQKLTGISFQATPAQMSIVGRGGGGRPISITISGMEDEVLKEISFKVEEILKSINGVADIDNSMRASENETIVRIDRLAAKQYGISDTDLSSAIRAGLQGVTTGVFRESGYEYDITVRYRNDQVKSPYDIGMLKVTASSGKQITVNQIAQVYQADAQRTISRQDRQDIARVSANIQGVDLGTVSNEIKQTVDSMALPFGYSISYGGSQKQMNDAFSSLGIVLIISIALVYMILVILYESFITPIVRMASLPCAAIGALLILLLTKNTINMMTIIGIIMLDGLASKNGTLLIDYTNTLLKKGIPLKEALIEAGSTRLRPIIMTTVTMIVGMLPAAIAFGDGSELKKGMATVVIGGMITSTLLTPIIVPVVYTLINDFKEFLTKRLKKNAYVAEVSNYEA